MSANWIDEFYVMYILRAGENSHARDRCLEIATLKVKNFREINYLHTEVYLPFSGIGEKDEMGIQEGGAESNEAGFDELRNYLGEGVALVHQIDRGLAAYLAHFLPEVGILDTFELALLLYPTLGNHSLSSLAQDLLKKEFKGDALEKARLHLRLIRWWRDVAKEIDSPLRLQAAAVLQALNSPWAYFFSSRRSRMVPRSFTEAISEPQTLKDKIEGIPGNKVDWEKVEGYLSEDGVLSREKEGFEIREEQRKMAMEVLESLNQGRFLAVEAGTGVGKSIAYLLPSCVFALEGGTRVVVSTYTKGLQDQIFRRDLPLLKQLFPSLRYTRLKGRGNYLCLRKWEDWSMGLWTGSEKEVGDSLTGETHPYQAYLYLLMFIFQTGEGDLEELPLELRERLHDYLGHLRSTPEECLGSNCPWREKCWVERARKRSSASHIVIVNHALLLSDVTGDLESGEHSILPEYCYLVVDEAHHLGGVATEAFSSRFSLAEGLSLVDRLESKRGLLQKLESFFAEVSQAPDSSLADQPFIHIRALRNGLLELRSELKEFFGSSLMRLARMGSGRGCSGEGDYEVKLRVTGEVRGLPEWRQLEEEGARLVDNLERIALTLARIEKALAIIDLPPQLEEERGGLLIWCGKVESRICGYADAVRVFLKDDPVDAVNPYIQWLEASPAWNYGIESAPRGEIYVAPVDISSPIKDKLFLPLRAGIFTSATLSTYPSPGGFDFFSDWSGLSQLAQEGGDVAYLLLGSPFDYSAQARFLVTGDMAEPPSQSERDPAYLENLKAVIGEALMASSGRALVLFTSYRLLDKVYSELCPELELEGISCMRQSKELSNARLLERFREDVRSVLFATASFWEGVDVPGESLSLLILTKLPFPYVGEPLLEGRMEYVSSVRGGDGWRDYYLPQAVMQFRQGLGRLIRSKSDRGVILLLDSRMLRRGYAADFLRTLPPGLSLEKVRSTEVAQRIREFLSMAG